MPCHGPTSWIYSRAISKMDRTGSFSVCGLENQLGTRFYQESAGAKSENGNSPANVLGLLGFIAARIV